METRPGIAHRHSVQTGWRMGETFGRVALLILLSVADTGCSGYAKSHADNGDALFNKQEYREAIAEYDRAVKFGADNPHVVRQLGLAHFRLSEMQDAYAYLSKSRTLKPADPEVRNALGRIYLINGRPREAVTEAQAALAAEPRNTDALDLLASAYLNQNNVAKAIETYRHWVDLFPRGAQAHYGLGVTLMVGRENAEARKEFETALALAPDHVDALTQLVNLDLLDKRSDDALARVQKQLAVLGRKPKLLLVLASVQASRGNQAGAEEAYKEAIRLDPSHSDARVALANFYASTGRLDQALPLVDSALDKEKTAPGYQLRAIIMQSRGDIQGARRAYEQALALNPRYTDAANNLAWLLSEKFGDNQRAYEIADAAYRLAPENPHIADTYGWIAFRAGDVKRSVTLLMKSAEDFPNAPSIRYHLGMALLASGDTAGGRRALSRAVSSTVPFSDRDAAQKALASLK